MATFWATFSKRLATFLSTFLAALNFLEVEKIEHLFLVKKIRSIFDCIIEIESERLENQLIIKSKVLTKFSQLFLLYAIE